MCPLIPNFHDTPFFHSLIGPLFYDLVTSVNNIPVSYCVFITDSILCIPSFIIIIHIYGGAFFIPIENMLPIKNQSMNIISKRC